MLGTMKQWLIFTQKSPVTEGYPARTIHPYPILVMLQDFNDPACLIEPTWVVANLILNKTHIAHSEGWEGASVLTPGLSTTADSLLHGPLAMVK